LFRGHRLRAEAGLLPPGLFPVLLARMATYLPNGTIHASRMWSNAAVLVFPHARVLLRLDAQAATVYSCFVCSCYMSALVLCECSCSLCARVWRHYTISPRDDINEHHNDTD
jgi:hypothetical protein